MASLWIERIVEIERGVWHQIDGVGKQAITAHQIRRFELIAVQKCIHTSQGLAAVEVGEAEGVAIKIAATASAQGGGVSTGGIQAPSPGKQIARLNNLGGEFVVGLLEALGSSLLVSQPLHSEDGGHQPAAGRDGGSDRLLGGLAEGHQACTLVGVGSGKQFGPEFDGVRNRAASSGDQCRWC